MNIKLEAEMSSVQLKTKAASILEMPFTSFINSISLIPVYESCSKHATASPPALLLHDFLGDAYRYLLHHPA